MSSRSVGRSAGDELQAVAEMDDETSLVMVLLRGSWGGAKKVGQSNKTAREL